MSPRLPADVAIRKVFYDGTPSYVWHGKIVELHDDYLVLEAYFTRDYRDLGYVVFEKNDLFVEFYYFDRWYNVFQIYSDRGELKGWYCNITRPARLDGAELHFTDLALDLFVYPDGSALPLDVEEFEEKALSEYEPTDVTAARAGFAELERFAAEGRMPGRPFHPRPADHLIARN